jgi:hypothetical protein
MRSFLAFAILLLGLPLLGLETALAETVDRFDAGDGSTVSAAADNEQPVQKSDRAPTLANAEPESLEASHAQDDANAEPQAPAPATSTPYGDEDDAASIGGLCHSLLTSAIENDLPVPFFANLIWQESRLQLDAVSRVGAQGIAQFMPSVAVEVGLANPFDPRQAIPASARMLRDLRTQFGNLGYVAAAYNAGAHRVSEWLTRGRTLPRETRTYVVRVTGRSVEQWRKAMVDDSDLTFAPLLPCRDLPAFADLEQAQQTAAEQKSQDTQAEDEHPEEEAAPVVAKNPHATRKMVGSRKVANRRLGHGRIIVAAQRLLVRGKIVAANRRPGQGKLAIAAHPRRGGGREATHRQRVPHEKRRIA